MHCLPSCVNDYCLLPAFLSLFLSLSACVSESACVRVGDIGERERGRGRKRRGKGGLARDILQFKLSLLHLFLCGTKRNRVYHYHSKHTCDDRLKSFLDKARYCLLALSAPRELILSRLATSCMVTAAYSSLIH